MKQFIINIKNWFKAITPWVKFAWEEYSKIRKDYNAAKKASK